MFRMIAALLLVAMPCLAAEFSVEAQGMVYSQESKGPNVGMADLTLTAVPDPLWGHASENDLERTEKQLKMEFPDLTVSGSGKTDAKGFFKFSVKITVPEGQQLPKTNDGGNPPSWYDYVFIKVNTSAEGYRNEDNNMMLYVDKENTTRHIYLRKIGRITGRLMSLSNMKPLAATTIIIKQRGVVIRGKEPPSWKVVTDAKGNFDMNDPAGPLGMIELALEDAALAFATTSRAWEDLRVANGDNDLGNLMVVPGCTVKLSVVESVEKKTVSVVIELHGAGQFRISEACREGVFDRSGIPEGKYSVKIVTGAYFGKEWNVDIAAGLNELGLIEVDPQLHIRLEVGVDQGQAPQYIKATAILLEGTPPTTVKKQREYFTYDASLHAGKGTIANMFKGRYWVCVTAQDWAPHWQIVDLPLGDKLTVTLTQGGSLAVTVNDAEGKPANIDWGAIAIPGTPAEQWLREKSDRIDSNPGNQPAGLLCFNAHSSPYKPGPLPTGKYLLRIKSSVGIVQRDIEIIAGKHLQLDLTPDPGRIEITITKDGKPAPGEKFLILTSDYMTRNPTVTEVHADSAGKYVFESKKATNVQVLLKREQEWVDSAKHQYEKEQRLESLADRRFYISLGTVVQLSVDCGGRERTWLTIELSLDEGCTVEGAAVYAQLARSKNAGLGATAQIEGTKLLFPMLRPGNYRLNVTVRTPERMITASELVRAEPKAEQTLKVKISMSEVTVTVKLPRSVKEDSANVSLMATPEQYPHMHFVGSASGGKKGKFTITGVPSGEYDVIVAAPNKDSTYTYYGSSRVSVSKNAKATVTVDENQGELDIDCMRPGPLPGMDDMPDYVRITLLDKPLKAVTIGRPTSAVGRFGTMRVQGIPAGTYTVRVEAIGCRPWESPVTIEKEKATRLSAALEEAQLLRLAIEPGRVPAILAQDFTLKLEDANGQPWPIGGLAERNLYFVLSQSGKQTLFVFGVTAEAKRLRLKLKGCKELVLDLAPVNGAFPEQSLKFESE